MVARGDLFGEGPGACPFVALDNDRDKRSDQPDYRHRCYAEPTPAPRALAHQEAFCLSPNFPTCPIFQDWAARAAARPVPAPSGYQGGRESAVAAAMAGAAADEPDAAPPVARANGEEDLLAASEYAAPGSPADDDEPAPYSAAAAASLAASQTEPEPEGDSAAEAEQLGAFDAPAADDAPFDAAAGLEPESEPEPDEDLRPAAPIVLAAATPAAFSAAVQDSAPPYEPSDEEDIPPVPPFLADRPAAPVSEAAIAAAIAADEAGIPRSSPGRTPSVDRVRREDVVPSWDIDGRYGAQAGGEPPDERSGTGLLTAIAVILILALGVAGVIFLPGILAGPGPTPRPSLSALPSSSASIAPSASLATPTAPATATATPGEPTEEPEPTASPRTYRIKAGDTLARIARRNDLTVADILAANPEISDPNDIFVGQIIVIPEPLPTAAP
ncbi:MAG TPA: LysM domain-containing protein [Candidatus Limnocylindrales bacterium]|nr:LysM domain-containing protein [Candidatus Limnocylindrales bacterium]